MRFVIPTVAACMTLLVLAAGNDPLHVKNSDECRRCHTDRERLMALTSGVPAGDTIDCGADPGEG